MQQILEFITHHWVLILALIVILGLIIHLETSSTVSGIRLLTTQEVTNLINHEEAVIVDIRPQSEYKVGHIINAISFPVDDAEEKFVKLNKYKSKPIIIACQTGQKGPAVAVKLQKAGFGKVFSLKGGIQTWRSENLPLFST